MKKMIIMVLFLITTLNANDSNSCVNLINIYNKTDYRETIWGQKGYEKQIRKYSIKEKELLFWKLLDNTDNVKFKFIDKRCYQLYIILKEKRFKIREKKLLNFKNKFFSEYSHKLKKQKQIIKTVDGCQAFASKYFRSFLNMSRDNFKSSTVAKRQYQTCLTIQSRKRK